MEYSHSPSGGITLSGRSAEWHQDDTLYPCIRYTLISNEHQHTLRGSAGFSTALIQLDIYSDTYLDKVELAGLVRARLHRFAGQMGAVKVLFAEVENQRDMVEPPDVPDDEWLYRRTIDVSITYRETRPELVLPLDQNSGQIEQAVFAYLSTHPTLNNFLEGRVYPEARPQGDQFPSLTYEVISSAELSPLTQNAKLSQPQFRLTVWAADYGEAMEIGEQVRSILDGLRGEMGGTHVRACLIDNDEDAYEWRADGSDEAFYSMPIEFSIFYSLPD